MICPQCQAEYRSGFTHCADCDVDLVCEGPNDPASSPRPGVEPGDPQEDPFCSFWKGDDPRIHAELCEVLDEGGIPHNTVFRKDHLFNLQNFPVYQIGVPFSLFEKAEDVVQEAFGNAADDAAKLLEAPPATESDPGTIRELPPLAPEAAVNIPGPSNAKKEEGWYRKEASAQVWAGEDEVSADFLAAALHENAIRCRVDRRGNHSALFVLPEDETRAGEIVREVREGKVPE
jgi:hypothetical protein